MPKIKNTHPLPKNINKSKISGLKPGEYITIHIAIYFLDLIPICIPIYLLRTAANTYSKLISEITTDNNYRVDRKIIVYLLLHCNATLSVYIIIIVTRRLCNNGKVNTTFTMKKNKISNMYSSFPCVLFWFIILGQKRVPKGNRLSVFDT